MEQIIWKMEEKNYCNIDDFTNDMIKFFINCQKIGEVIPQVRQYAAKMEKRYVIYLGPELLQYDYWS